MKIKSSCTGRAASRRRLVSVIVALLALATMPAEAGTVEIIGHRGNSSAAPENTLAAINSAFNVGADHVEVDIRLTSDGHAILMHDSSVDRTTDTSGAIANMTLAEVQQLDAGSSSLFSPL